MKPIAALMLTGALFTLAGAASPSLASAETPEAAEQVERDPAADLPPGFQPIRGKEEEAKVDPSPLVVGAYGAILAGLLLYVVFIARRQGQLSREIEELAREVAAKSE